MTLSQTILTEIDNMPLLEKKELNEHINYVMLDDIRGWMDVRELLYPEQTVYGFKFNDSGIEIEIQCENSNYYLNDVNADPYFYVTENYSYSELAMEYYEFKKHEEEKAQLVRDKQIKKQQKEKEKRRELYNQLKKEFENIDITFEMKHK